MKVAVTFSPGMVLDMSPGVISTGTPPRRETYKVTPQCGNITKRRLHTLCNRSLKFDFSFSTNIS